MTNEIILENRKLWADALQGRSGKEYRKHTGGLAGVTYRSFCCLGVAAEAVPALGLVRTMRGAYKQVNGVELDTELAESQMEKLGISTEMMDFLIELNDKTKASLSDIGDVILKLPVVSLNESSFSKYEFLASHPDLAYLGKHAAEG